MAGAGNRPPEPLVEPAMSIGRARRERRDQHRGADDSGRHGRAGPARLIFMLSAEDVRNACLDLPEAEEYFPFGPETSVFRVGGRLFALCQLGAEPPLRINLKCEPELATGLRAAHPAILPGYHMNKRHWNTVVVDGTLDDRMVLDMIEDSYDLIVAALPKATRTPLQLARNDEQVVAGRDRETRRGR